MKESRENLYYCFERIEYDLLEKGISPFLPIPYYFLPISSLTYPNRFPPALISSDILVHLPSPKNNEINPYRSIRKTNQKGSYKYRLYILTDKYTNTTNTYMRLKYICRDIKNNVNLNNLTLIKLCAFF